MIDTQPKPFPTDVGGLAANVAVARRFVTDVVNEGRMDAIPDLVHAGYKYHGPGGVEAEGVGGAEQVISEFRSGFSDLQAEITSEIAQDDRVALTIVLTGTHDGDLAGIPPTGERIELPLAIITRIEDGLIVEDWEYYDSGTIMAQLGFGAPEA
jgi:steroid delta-isomerase-like uncharacterized protein